MLTRQLLQLFEADDALRQAERRVHHEPSADSHRQYSALLRRADRGREADMHLLHARGHERAGLYDANKHAWDQYRKVSGSDDKKGSTPAIKTAVDLANKLHQAKHEKTDEWDRLAKKVHAAGDNPGLAFHRPSSMHPAKHRFKLANLAAHHNDVEHDDHYRYLVASDHVDEKARTQRIADLDARNSGHQFSDWADHFSLEDDQAVRKLARTTREHHAALRAHHPDLTPQLGDHSSWVDDTGQSIHHHRVNWKRRKD